MDGQECRDNLSFHDIASQAFIEMCFYHNQIQFCYLDDDLDRLAEWMTLQEMRMMKKVSWNVPQTDEEALEFQRRFNLAREEIYGK